METYVPILWGSAVAVALGCAALLYYLRTRKRWVWAVAVLLLTLGLLGLTSF